MRKFGWIKRVMMSVAVPVMALSMTLAAPVNVKAAEDEGAAEVAAVMEQAENAVYSAGSMAAEFGVPAKTTRFMGAAKATSGSLSVNADGDIELNLDQDLNLTLNGTKKVRMFLVNLNGHKLTINGKGTIQASVGMGFAGKGSVVLNGGAKLIVKSTVSGAESSFICEGNLIVNKGTVKVTTRSVHPKHIAVILRNSITIKSGSFSVTASNGLSGIGVAKNMTVKGGKVSAKAGAASSIGLVVGGKLSMTKGQLSASGMTGAISAKSQSVKKVKIRKPSGGKFYRLTGNSGSLYTVRIGESIAKSVIIK